MKNPIKERIDHLGLSTHAVARIIEFAQVNVWKHYHGKRRPSFDAMEMYNLRLGIPLNDLRKWNKELKQILKDEKERDDDENQGTQGGDCSTDTL